MPVPPSNPPSTGSRPLTRQVLNKIKRRASALVKSPNKTRPRSYSCTQATPNQPEEPPVPVPTLTVVSATSVPSPSSARARSVSCYTHDDARSMATSVLHIGAPSGGDFMPYLPLATRLERRGTNASQSTARFSTLPSTPPPLSIAPLKRPVIPPLSPSRSERSNSTSSTRSPITPVFSHNPFASNSAHPQGWPTHGDEPEAEQSVDPFTKGRARVVLRSLIKDDFLLACAAVDDSSVSTSEENSRPVVQSPKSRRRSSVFRKGSAVSLPPLKPPPSCPLPSPPPPSVTSEDSDAIRSSTEKSDGNITTPADEEWTLFLGTPSKPLRLHPALDDHKKGGISTRGRSGSSPSAPLTSKQHLSPTDIPAQVKEELQARVRTISNLSTRSSATIRRIESGPAVSHGSFEDWTLSLPLLKKPKSSLCVNPSTSTNIQESALPEVNKTRKCKSFAEWTTSLSDEYEREERRLRELEREREREMVRERKSSRVSITSISSSTSKTSQRSVKVKRQLPIGPGSSSPVHPQAMATGSTNILSNLNSAASRSSLSLCSSAASFRTTSTSKSYKGDPSIRSPTSTGFSFNTSAATSTVTLPATMRSVSTLGQFPLPPSFSSELLQRRQAVPPLPKPLLPACSLRSSASAMNVKAYTSPWASSSSHMNQPVDADIASAPATTLCFTVPPSMSLLSGASKRRPESHYYVAPSTASSTSSSAHKASSTVSRVNTRSSVKTNSSASTIVPKRSRASRLVDSTTTSESGTKFEGPPPPAMIGRPGEGSCCDVTEATPRSSIESSTRATEYDTCTEGGHSDVTEAESMVSGAYFSARSSLSL